MRERRWRGSLSSGSSSSSFTPRELLTCLETTSSYSLGGLVARYVLGLLDSRTPSFFSHTQPKNFTTFASPWIGIPAYDSFWSRTFRYLGGRLLSRTGRQLYERDRFLPVRFADGVDKKGARGKKEKVEAAPLLRVMADPRYSFYRALRKFERIVVFANMCVASSVARSSATSQP